MTDVFSALFNVVGISLVGLILAGWYSVGVLEVFSLRLRRVHDWAQLRLHARRVGLMAYKDAHSKAIRDGSNAECAGDGPTMHGLGGAAKGLRAESY
jgi:hypothetical protein